MCKKYISVIFISISLILLTSCNHEFSEFERDLNTAVDAYEAENWLEAALEFETLINEYCNITDAFDEMNIDKEKRFSKYNKLHEVLDKPFQRIVNIHMSNDVDEVIIHNLNYAANGYTYIEVFYECLYRYYDQQIKEDKNIAKLEKLPF